MFRTFFLSTRSFETCPLSRSPMYKESLYRWQTGRPPFITDCRLTCIGSARRPGSYLAFLGRISPEKRVDRAIEIAKRIQIPLKIAAKVDRVDKKYFKSTYRAITLSTRWSRLSARSATGRRMSSWEMLMLCCCLSTGRSHLGW